MSKPALLIQALPSLLFKFIHTIAHFSSAATGSKLSTLTFLLPTAPRSPSQGLASRVACEPWLRDGIYIHSFSAWGLDTLVSC